MKDSLSLLEKVSAENKYTEIYFTPFGLEDEGILLDEFLKKEYAAKMNLVVYRQTPRFFKFKTTNNMSFLISMIIAIVISLIIANIIDSKFEKWIDNLPKSLLGIAAGIAAAVALNDIFKNLNGKNKK